MSTRKNTLTLLVQKSHAVARIIYKADAMASIVQRTLALTLCIQKTCMAFCMQLRWHSLSRRQMPWHILSGWHLAWHSASIRHALCPDGKYPDTPHPEGKCCGMHHPDNICTSIIPPEGQWATYLCLVHVCTGCFHLEQYGCWHASSGEWLPRQVAFQASRYFRCVWSIWTQNFFPDTVLLLLLTRESGLLPWSLVLLVFLGFVFNLIAKYSTHFLAGNEASWADE